VLLELFFTLKGNHYFVRQNLQINTFALTKRYRIFALRITSAAHAHVVVHCDLAQTRMYKRGSAMKSVHIANVQPKWTNRLRHFYSRYNIRKY
jgi:tRNA splicing ligase